MSLHITGDFSSSSDLISPPVVTHETVALVTPLLKINSVQCNMSIRVESWLQGYPGELGTM